MTGRSIAPGLVSTIIPVYNRPQKLGEAVESVLRQEYSYVEVIIVDDGSTDDTASVASGFANTYGEKVKLIHSKNKGPGGARELGRGAASGEYLQYLDSDDLLRPGKFERQVDALQRCTRAGVVYCKTRHYNCGESPQDIPWRNTGERVENMFPYFLVERLWSTVTPLYRRSVTDEAGAWTDLRQEEDWEYDCRIASFGTRLAYVSEFLADQRTHDGDRLSHAWMHDKSAMRDRARARELIYGHALSAGITSNALEMQNFSRQLFHVSRLCGCAGLYDESRRLFELSREAAGSARAKGMDFRVYRILAKVLGWRNTALLCTKMERFRFSPITTPV